MREAEGRLFGHAWLENDRSRKGDKVAARRSQVRLRLSAWTQGKLAAGRWEALPTVRHPEVTQAVPADLYLGYGPVVLPRRQRAPTLKAGAAIQAGEEAGFSLAAPDDAAPTLLRALSLMNCFGTLGGRSRNGWGSFVLTPEGQTPALAGELDPDCVRPWSKALELDWPHAIGSDARGPLVWQFTEAASDWKAAMRALAQLKIDLRTQFHFPEGRPDGEVRERHWLSYPVTNHSVRDWGGNARLPNALRFKVRADAEGKLRGLVFHVPCKPPPAFRPDDNAIRQVWKRVHEHLDRDSTLQRIPG
jgi:CRISPR-associated protein Cmr1